MIRVDPSPILLYLYIFIRSESIRVDLPENVRLSSAENITRQDEMVPPSFISR